MLPIDTVRQPVDIATYAGVVAVIVLVAAVASFSPARRAYRVAQSLR